MKLAVCSIIILIVIINNTYAQAFDLSNLINTSSPDWRKNVNITTVEVNNISDIEKPMNDPDKDRIPDAVENYGYKKIDINKTDTDGDGISDFDEIHVMPYSTDPYSNDTDGDGLSDLREYWWLCDPTKTYSARKTKNDGELLDSKKSTICA